MKKTDPGIVTPFDWQRYTAAQASDAPQERARKAAPSRAKKLSVRERVERIMAPRWGNPYCKPGASDAGALIFWTQIASKSNRSHTFKLDCEF